MSYAGEGERVVTGSALLRCGRIAVTTTLVVLVVGFVSATSASAFTVQGSVEQVDVTGLAPERPGVAAEQERCDRVHAGSRLRREACCSGT